MIQTNDHLCIIIPGRGCTHETSKAETCRWGLASVCFKTPLVIDGHQSKDLLVGRPSNSTFFFQKVLK